MNNQDSFCSEQNDAKNVSTFTIFTKQMAKTGASLPMDKKNAHPAPNFHPLRRSDSQIYFSNLCMRTF